MLSEKNACPSASRITFGVILLKSGLNRKRKPSPAPSNVSDRIHKSKRRASNKGISILVYRSIPFLTPDKMINAVKLMNIMNHKYGRNDPVRKSLNIFVRSLSLFPDKFPASA